MAIKLPEDYKGYTAEYWRINKLIYNDIDDSASVDLWLYADKNKASLDLNYNALERVVLKLDGIKNTSLPEDMTSFTNPRDLLKAMLYMKIMESKKVQKVDENNNPVFEIVDGNEVPVMVELNKWATGEAC